MSKLPSTSTHRLKDGSVVTIQRCFSQQHLDANYHLQEFSGPSNADHDLLGEYHGHDGSRVFVRHLEKGPTEGPEFEIQVLSSSEWSDLQKMIRETRLNANPSFVAAGVTIGMRLTTIHEENVEQYLIQFGAATLTE